MADRSFLDWPFFDARRRDWAVRLEAWAAAHLAGINHGDVHGACRDLVAQPGRGGWLAATAVDPTEADSRLDVRSLCLARQSLARHDGLADFAFAMRGLGDKAVQIHGGDGVRTGHVVERPYREIRARRIYEGASDVQKVIIARQTLANLAANTGGGRLRCLEHLPIWTPSPGTI